MEEEGKQYGYGKRPLWQWLFLYAVVVVVIYGLIYYFVLAKKGGYNNNNSAAIPSYTTPTTNTQSTPSSAVKTQKITVVGTEFAISPFLLVV